MWMTCGQHDSETLGEISLEDDICHLHIIHMSSTHCADDISMSSTHCVDNICMSSTRCADDVQITCGRHADDKRQQLCIKPTGFLVVVVSLTFLLFFFKNLNYFRSRFRLVSMGF